MSSAPLPPRQMSASYQQANAYVPPTSQRPATAPMYPRSDVSSPSTMQQTMQGPVDAVNKGVSDIQHKAKTNGIWSLVILVIVITIVLMLLFWLLKIPIVLTTNAAGALTTDVSFWKLLGTSFVGALILVAIIWGISKFTNSK